MRLLSVKSNDDFELATFNPDEIPPYAILSHTWSDGEVTYDELMGGTGKNKPGYAKLRFCGERAAHDRLQYFWVDTCCINKSNLAELQDAIASMFRWYRGATKCYVYLPDVSLTKRKRSNDHVPSTWEQAFRQSRWFTRGWTLQELLAPTSVEFFSKEGSRLGDKQYFKQQIHEITGLPLPAIQGEQLSKFSVNERVSWTESRQTTLEEDLVYSLLGIFDVNMPLRYGEGKMTAFTRLHQEIDKLEICMQVLYLTDPRKDKRRIEDTKGGLLEESYCWILDNSNFQQWYSGQQNRLLWVKGDPGKGKTMLLCGIINELDKTLDKIALLSYFFCQATDLRLNNATAVLRGLMYLLVSQQPSLVSHIQKQYNLVGKPLFEDSNAWVALSEIFTDMLNDARSSRVYLVIDALDECLVDLPKLLRFIAEQSTVSSRVKWIISSRNWHDIEQQLERAGDKIKLSLELNTESISAAVNAYLQHRVLELAQWKKYNSKTRDAVLDYLSRNCGNTFLWAALVCQNLEQVHPLETFERLNEFPPGLNSLYGRMMQQLRLSYRADLCKRILATMAVVFRPVTLHELMCLVDMPDDLIDHSGSVLEITRLCGSFLAVRDRTIYFMHQSAKDYLLQEASNEIFPSGLANMHHTIMSRSLRTLSLTLRRDIYDLRAPGYPIDRVKRPSPDPLIMSRYACVYWINHLLDWFSKSSAGSYDDFQGKGIVENFIKEKYLYWLEALSLCKSMSEGVVAIGKLAALFQARTKTHSFLILVKDAHRLILYHKLVIENYPLQAYTSALIFSPASSLIRNYFKHEEPDWIKIMPVTEYEWSACLQTLEGHCGLVRSVALSYDSSRLASASQDKTVRIWDLSSGKCLQTLKCNRDLVDSISALHDHDPVYSVAFSHDASQLASPSWEDISVRIWDTNNGTCLLTLKGHSASVRSVAFSHDSSLLASASEDKTVKIWDTNSGACLQTLEGHYDRVYSITFAHDSSRLISASWDKTVRIWDAYSGACLKTLKGHCDQVRSAVFSHDSSQLASASEDKTIKIWNANSGTCQLTLEGHRESVRSVAFSHDSSRLASASRDNTIRIWDASDGTCIQTLEGHRSSVYSVAYSHDSRQLASASWDATIKVWDTSRTTCVRMLECHRENVCSAAISHDSSRFASASWDKTINIWDTASGTCILTLKGHRGSVDSVAFSHDSSRLASASWDKTIKIWDVSNGACLQTLEGHDYWFGPVAFSHDSNRLASGARDDKIRIWNTSNGACLQTLEGHRGLTNSLAFSHHSSWLASASMDSTVRVWNTSNGTCVRILEGHRDRVYLVAFAHDSSRLASASWDNTIRIWNASSGACLQVYSVSDVRPKTSFHSDLSDLHTDIDIITLEALLASNIQTGITKGQNLQDRNLRLSSNGEWIIYNSDPLVWLPPDYRPSASAVSGTMIGVGVGTGKVWMCNLQIEKL